MRDPRSNERRGDRLGGVGVDGGPRRVLEKERAQEERLRVRLVRVHLDAERVGGGEHGGGGVRGRIANQSRASHQRAFPRARPTKRVRRHHPRDVEVRVVGGCGRGTKLPVDELRGASSRGGVGEVDELEEREELPGDESRAGVGVIGDEREEIRRRRGERRLERLELLTSHRRGHHLILTDGGGGGGAALVRGGVEVLAHHAPIHRRLGRHEPLGLLRRDATQTAARGVTVRHGLRHLRGFDLAAGDEFLDDVFGDAFVGLGVERGEEREDVALEREVPTLEHVDSRRANRRGTLGEAATDGGGAERDGDGVHGDLTGEREESDAANVVGGVARTLDDVRDGVVGDGERTQNRLADILHLLRAEKLEEGGRDGVLAEITALATVLETRERARRLRANGGRLIAETLEHDLLHALVQVVGDLGVGAERVEHAGDDLAHAEAHSLILSGGEVEKETEERLGEIVSLVLRAGVTRGGEVDQETNHALGAEVALRNGGGEEVAVGVTSARGGSGGARASMGVLE